MTDWRKIVTAAGLKPADVWNRIRGHIYHDDEVEGVLAALAPVFKALVAAHEAEIARLRAALAMSDQPCAYCSLPAVEWNRCASGFPGCARGDDAVGCPHLGAALSARDELEAAVAAERVRCGAGQ